MNGIDLFLQPPMNMAMSQKQPNHNQQTDHEHSIFAGLLLEESAANPQMQLIDELNQPNLIITLTENEEVVDAEVILSETDSLLASEDSAESSMSLLLEMMSEDYPLNMIESINEAADLAMNDEEIANIFNQLFTEIKQILETIENDSTLKKAVPRLLTLLEQWTSLKNTAEEEAIVLDEDTKEAKVWKELLSTFERRQQFVSSNHYKSDAVITTTTIENWLKNALHTYEEAKEQSSFHVQQTMSSMPMSKVEQYMIHINRIDPIEPTAKALINEMQNIIQSSRFLSRGGMNQLTISIHPEHLGDMMIRLTEVNGEMTVKIIVASSMIKQMLESNLHQLKHMFSPHQVIIEKQDNDMTIIQEDLEQNDSMLQEENEPEDKDTNHKQQRETDEDFKEVFLESLLNEEA